ncbi:MAG: lytic transglycosylase domain-containing protein [Alphaproteobacteria bacterium]|nr:lytic transglycosylase domain-containing protein [Alphaproteobacteria bacterium]
MDDWRSAFMHVLKPRLAAAAAVLLVMLGAVAPGAAAAQTPLDSASASAAQAGASLPAWEMDRMRNALAAARLGAWDDVRAYRAAAVDPLARRILLWRLASDRDAPATFMEIDQALKELSGWPGRDTMRRRGEQAILDSGLSAADRIQWLTADQGPVSGDGQAALASAYGAAGRRAEAVELARSTWRERTLTPRAEALLLSDFGGVLTADDHADRVEGLLWRDDRAAAQRILPRLRPADRAVAQARIALQQRRAKGLSKVLAAVPASRRDDTGLVYDRIRYIRRDGRPEDAVSLVLQLRAADAPSFAREAIVQEQRLFIPRLLRSGQRSAAYRISSEHGLRSGETFADSEWMAGWLQLRFLGDPAKAEAHFARLDANVRTPVSRARALYWRAQALKALGRTEDATARLSEAADLPFTFYGQLAATERDPAAMMSLGDPPVIDDAVRAAFEERELVRVLRVMAVAGTRADFENVSFAIDDQLSSAADHEMLSAIARSYGYYRTAVRSAKAGMRRGIVAKEAAYPLLTLPEDARLPGRPEPALVHAITRQESEFDTQAISPVGARGLMQLMPATAQATARMIGMPYDRARLTDDGVYNLTLGAAHLEELIEEFNGSYVMAIAAYNAGSSRPRQWNADWGDPRSGALDIVDWIELIPFSETRNYTMRVMENLQVYRYRIAGTPTPIGLRQDLRRGFY